MNPMSSQIATRGNESDKQALSAFIEALINLSRTRDYNAVAAPFAGFQNLEDEPNSGGTFWVHGENIYNVIVHLDRSLGSGLAFCPPRSLKLPTFTA